MGREQRLQLGWVEDLSRKMLPCTGPAQGGAGYGGNLKRRTEHQGLERVWLYDATCWGGDLRPQNVE